jgi:hypothetical protein
MMGSSATLASTDHRVQEQMMEDKLVKWIYWIVTLKLVGWETNEHKIVNGNHDLY